MICLKPLWRWSLTRRAQWWWGLSRRAELDGALFWPHCRLCLCSAGACSGGDYKRGEKNLKEKEKKQKNWSGSSTAEEAKRDQFPPSALGFRSTCANTNPQLRGKKRGGGG